MDRECTSYLNGFVSQVAQATPRTLQDTPRKAEGELLHKEFASMGAAMKDLQQRVELLQQENGKLRQHSQLLECVNRDLVHASGEASEWRQFDVIEDFYRQVERNRRCADHARRAEGGHDELLSSTWPTRDNRKCRPERPKLPSRPSQAPPLEMLLTPRIEAH